MELTLRARPRRLPKASDLVVSGVRRHIITRRLPVGAPLPSESELMAEYGVGRVAVREAFRLLERDGLIEIRRGVNGGVFVRHPDISQVSEVISLLFAVKNTTLREFVEFRQLVEPAAAAHAAKNISAEQREQLAVILRVDEDLAHVPDLHLLVAEATGNGVLALALNALRHPFQEHFRPGRIDAGHMRETSAAHAKIAKRILAGDASGAQRAMTVHLAAYRDYLERENLMEEPIIPPSTWSAASGGPGTHVSATD